MPTFGTVESILSVRHWALEETFFQTMAPLVKHRLAHGHDLSVLKQDRLAGLRLRQSANENLLVFEDAPRIAMVGMTGTLMKYNGLCSTGMLTMENMIESANQDDDIDAIVLFTDTPGGTVDGTANLGAVVSASIKPVVAYVSNMMASAGVWVGSQCDHIVLNKLDPTASVGSIGTLCVHVYEGEVLEKNLGEVTIFRAEQSVDKARFNSLEPLTEAQKTEMVTELTEITDLFIDTVRQGRGERLKETKENVFTGKMYSGKRAKQLGLVDQLGTLEDAITQATRLSKKSSQLSVAAMASGKNPKSTQMSLANWFGRDKNAQEEASEITASTEELKTLEADMQAAVQEKETLAAQVADLQAERAQSVAAAAASAERIAELEAQVAELEKHPGEEATEAGKEADASSSDATPSFASEDHTWNAKANKALGL